MKSNTYAVQLRKGAEKVFGFSYFHLFLLASQPKAILLDELKKLEQRSYSCMELKGEYVD
jgi:hypothetical protein